MLKLTSIHIDEIRRYFLAVGEEEQLTIKKNIKPAYLSGFLTDLKQLFNSPVAADAKIVAIAKNMGAEEFAELLKEIRQDYYSLLAQQYNSDILNADISLLVKAGNTEFLREVAFQKEIKIAFLLNERTALKKKFQQLDEESDIGEDEMSLAFKLIERQQLKKQFKKIENEEATTVNPPVPVVKFNWKRLAIAASLIGLVLTTTFIILKNDKKLADVVSNQQNSKKANMDTNKILNPIVAATDLYVNLFPSDEKQVKVLKEQSLGFAAKDEYIMVQTYYMGDSLKGWKDIVKNDAPERKIMSNEIITSLNNFVNKYMFKRDTIEIYLLKKQAVKLFEINAENYLQIGKVIYECKKSQDLLPLKKVIDKKTQETINKIIFNESN